MILAGFTNDTQGPLGRSGEPLTTTPGPLGKNDSKDPNYNFYSDLDVDKKSFIQKQLPRQSIYFRRSLKYQTALSMISSKDPDGLTSSML